MTKHALNIAVAQRLEKMQFALSAIPDETAVDAVELFIAWHPKEHYVRGHRLKWQGKLYRVEQEHDSQAGWEPDKTPALFTEIPKPGEIPEWKQPIKTQDAYMQGDKVYYPKKGDQIYMSEIDNNVWQPGVYGWKAVQNE